VLGPTGPLVNWKEWDPNKGLENIRRAMDDAEQFLDVEKFKKD